MNQTPEQTLTQELPPKLSNTRCLRIRKDDSDEIMKLCKELNALGWDVDIVKTIRDCVHAGLPLIKERYAPVLKGTTDEPATISVTTDTGTVHAD